MEKDLPGARELSWPQEVAQFTAEHLSVVRKFFLKVRIKVSSCICILPILMPCSASCMQMLLRYVYISRTSSLTTGLALIN